MIKLSKPRTSVQVQFPDGRTYDGPFGSTIEDFVKFAQPKMPGQITAALVNDKLRELTLPLYSDTVINPIDSSTSDGMRIYRRSLTFLLIAAAAELYPNDTINIAHSMPSGGYYCERSNGIPYTTKQLTDLEDRMRTLASADVPINSVRVPLSEAVQLFLDNNDKEKAELFAKRRKDNLKLYELNGVRDYFHGFMVPSTGYLNLFKLRAYGNGFILQFPRRHAPNQLQPFEDEPWLAHVFQEYDAWLRVIGIPSVAALNRAIEIGRIREVILVAEALHNRQLADIADSIVERGQVRIVLVAGPTSAGKTTFSKRLAVQLLARGLHPVAIALDNYFVNREDTPRDEDGGYNFEHIEAIDLHLFQQQMHALLAGETIVQPVFNFKTGTREQGQSLRIGRSDVLIIEGIHGLNPRLVEGLPTDTIYRIAINAFTQLNLDRHNRVPTTDTRKLRRIVRDYYHRGYSAADTIKRWPSVRRGEKTYIFSYQDYSDAYFNSALVYELAALKPLAQPILLQVEPGLPERIEANRLMAFLQWFTPIPADGLASIPSDSIMREFIGGSIMEDYSPWLDKNRQSAT
ncbi:MAG: nucleoside kinase [Anaerolineae bacterium]|nr:nucleoside kinase [Anaerolineae bacterium]MCO5198808.1 nucleoside kinase [Anaerolineae bacterium]MCO5205524.1 nucleoside kinase [Anaerolineae bacterium]